MGKQFNSLKKNIGFTLTELIVTMAVSAVLLSASVAGIIAWVHHADYVRNENYAETIYYAAQAELTRYRGNGQLKELADYVTKDENLKVPVEEIDPAIAAKYTDRLYYLKKGAGPVEEDDRLGGLLSDYIYDGSIMDGAICVEFDPNDGTVYSVSYSDRNTDFTYNATSEHTDEKEISLLDRSEDARKKNRVGYYSVDLSAAAPKAAKEKIRLERVELVNEDQLYLRWSLPERYRDVRGFLSYTIDIYQKAQDTGGKKYSFDVKGNELKEKSSETGMGGYIITCQNGDDAADQYQFIAYMDENGQMYLVLDSIDYGVTPDKIEKDTLAPVGDPSFKTDAFRNSASILQLFAEPEDIYIKVQARGMVYKSSAQKQSNMSNTLFASMTQSETGGKNNDCYEIKNARHLYNIRYTEKENSLVGNAKDLCYQQTADITWLADEEKLFHSSVSTNDPLVASEVQMHPLEEKDKCAKVSKTANETSEKVPYFPAIPSLGGSSILEVSGRAYELKEFVMYQGLVEAENEATESGIAEAAETGDEEAGEAENGTAYALGLVAKNEGLIQNLKITDVNVQGIENVGAVCGKNSGNGKVWNTTVSGIVTGKENVGGIVGLDDTTSGAVLGAGLTEEELKEELKKSSYINLINYALVTGSDGKVGGVVGSLGEKGQAYLCENYGAVKGEKIYTAYIGGITGYNKGLVQDCISAPGEEVNGELDQTALKGIFVGGVVGCNNGGTIKDSGTEKESKKLVGSGSDAYVIGYRYVGGIVGYNNGKVGTDDNRDTTDTLVKVSPDTMNEAKVIGHDYVGGIVGANGILSSGIEEDIKALTEGALEACEIKEEYSSLMLVEDWTNTGIVEAVGGNYAGGIAGYNAGDLKNCTTSINTASSGASQLLDQVRLYGTASYVGGVAGCNIGHIYNKENENGEIETVSVNSVVSGKNYVGGIVGYNGKAEGSTDSNSGKIENYKLTGGNIYGESYVGGYAGLNTTENLLWDGNVLSSSPNEVNAKKYFAGGVMGALILVPEKNNAVIKVNCEANNSFGSVTAGKAFAGGYVGYTQLLKKGENAKKRAENLYANLNTPKDLADAVLAERASDMDHKTAEIQFGYDDTDTDTPDTRGVSFFNSVEAPIFAGGVIGGNSWNTKLLLQNIDNKVPVKATTSVTCDVISTSRNTKNGSEEQDTFSFAGGIIGLVTPNATIHRCGNSGAGNVDGQGTYSGGIAEVNLGMICNCTVGSVSGKSYYGGIAGLNIGGTIENETIENETIIRGIIHCELNGRISGESYLGGIVACNEGIIDHCSVYNNVTSGESAVIGTGSYIGGIAAVSRERTVTVIDGKNQIKKCTVEANIGADNMGEYVGGLVGKFAGGSLSDSKVTASNIYGLDHVGGIAGEICADLIKENGATEISNAASVTAARAAGGIGGYLNKGKVSGCENSGDITSRKELAGGIVPEIGSGSSVENCLNSGSVMSMGAMAGGIAAKNSGSISRCSVVGNDSKTSATVKGIDAIGGIAGENRGTIASCRIEGNVAVSDVNPSGNGQKIGGIAGKNMGKISASTVAAKDAKYPAISTMSQESYLGGIAGTNMPDGTNREDSGKITGGTIDLDVDLKSGQSGTVGGAVGANGGTISNVTFFGTVEGTSGSAYGTGGISGRNELDGTAGSISGCVLIGVINSGINRGIVKATSNDSGFGGSSETVRGVYVGGICGVNPEGGSVTNCYLKGASKVSGDYGHVGGIVAFNLGEVGGSGLDKNDTTVYEGNPEIFSGKDVPSGTGGTKHENGKCVIGGIVGYNGVSGKLGDCTTGKWNIQNSIGDNDEGYPTGGIIGCNKSIYDQSRLENNATVRGGWMSGGIIGLQSTEQRGSNTIERCENHGNVTASVWSAGGIIGDWRSPAGRVRECINDGAVSISKGGTVTTAGGIIGNGHRTGTVSITIERCGNEGTISHAANNGAGKAAGIFGNFNANTATLNLTITDCYNAAEIQNNSTSCGVSSGISAGTQGGGTVNLAITRCVNYGRGTDKTKLFAGIAYRNDGGGTKKVEHCLNVGECYTNQKPITYQMPNHDGRDNYYFSNPVVGGFVVDTNDNGYNGKEGTANNGYKVRASQVAELNDSSGKFQDINITTESGRPINTHFDSVNERLYLDANNNKYLQFTDVTGTYQPSGGQEAIRSLKENFGSGDDYALLSYVMTHGTFQAPKSVKLEETNGVYRVTYEPDTDAIFCTAKYEVEIGDKADFSGNSLVKATIDDPTKNTWTIAEEKLFEGKDRAQYTKIWARVRAVKADGYDNITAPVEGKYSSWTNGSEGLETLPKLPTPKLCFEVIKADDGGKIWGYLVLENTKEYADYSGCEVNSNIGSPVKFDAETIKEAVRNSTVAKMPKVSPYHYQYSSTQSKPFTATAVSPDGKYRQSDTFEETFDLYVENATLTARRDPDSYYGQFDGIKEGELSYKFSLQQAIRTEKRITFRADFLLNEREMGSGFVLLPRYQGPEDCTIDLSSMDQNDIREMIYYINHDEGDKVKVRFYPWEIGSVRYYYTTTDSNGKEVLHRTVQEAGFGEFKGSLETFDLSSLKGKYEMYPEPKCGESVTTTTADDGSIKYTLYWDASDEVDNYNESNYAGAEYTVTVTGKIDEDTQVVLYRKTVQGNRVELPDNNWKYKELILNVERLGKEADDGTKYIGASSEANYEIPVRLSYTSITNAKLPDDRNSMVYRVSWMPSPEKEYISGYQIIMRGEDEDGKAISPVKVNVVDDDGVLDPDATSTEIDLDLDKFSSLKEAKKIRFSVVVLSGNTQYANSRESAPVPCDIPDRLTEPEKMPELKLKDGTSVEPLQPEKFTDLSLQLTNINASSENAAYQIEYFVTNLKVGDGVLNGWNAATSERPKPEDEGIYISAEPVTMVGNLQSAYYMLNQPRNFNAEQAGRTLWYRIRAVSPSKISSVWTDWQSVKLPKALLAPVEIPKNQTWERECSYTINGADSDKTITMRQPKLGFAPVEFAKGYEIYIKEAETYELNEDTGKMEVTAGSDAEHTYTLEEADTGGTPGQLLVLKEGGTEKPMVSEAADSGETIWSCDLYSIEHSYKLTGGDTEYTYKIKTAAKLCYSVKNDAVQEIWLELPEGVALDKDGSEISGGKFIATAAVDITVIEPDERYVVEEMTRWQRVQADAESITITRVDVKDGHSTEIAVAGYFEDTLSADELSDQALQMFGLSRIPSASLPEKMSEEETPAEEEKPKEEEKKKTESGAQKSGVSGNNTSAGQ